MSDRWQVLADAEFTHDKTLANQEWIVLQSKEEKVGELECTEERVIF